MISSGIKRGLAGSAVAALAVTGLPFLASSASANPLADQLAAGAITLYTPDDLGAASIKNDGVNTTVHLLANGGTDVVQVRFEYSSDAGATWTAIGTVGRSNGAFSTEWNPPTAIYNLPVQLRAVAINNIGNDGANDNNTVTVTSNQDAIDISNAAGSAVGVFQQPYAGPNDKLLGAASATTSDVAADPAVTFSSPYNATTNAEDTKGTPAGGTRTVSGPVDFTGYNFGTATDADQAIVEANVGGAAGGSDAEAVTLYQQQINGVTATAASPTVQAGQTTSATVKVVDQNGAPVVGAEVFQDDNQDGTGDGAAKYTNSKGEVTFTGLDGTTAGKAHYFFVNTTNNVAYENGTDFKRSVTVTEYTPAAASITPSSADGAAFDFDENAAGDIQVTVKDQNGNAMNGQVVRYAWTVTPFATTAGYPKQLAEQSTTTGPDGKANIAFPAGEPAGTYVLHTYINQDGTPGQQSGDLGGTDLTVKAGQADIKWNDGTVAQAQSNTTKTFGAKLVLGDGTALGGRNIAITWAPGAGGNAVVSSQAQQPAGTTRTGDNSATTTTAADGTFGVALTDPPATTPPGPQNETGGVLTATTANTPNIGNAGDSSSLNVDFLKSVAPAAPGDIIVSSQDLIDGMATPGRPVDLDVTVKNADGDTLTDFPVTISVDHGFLSPNAETAGALTPDPAPAQDGQYGEWKSDGTSKDLTTDDTGVTGAVVAIEKDAAFDTSQDVTTTVTIKAGNVTKTVPVTFTSENPLNGGDVSFELDDNQTVTVLPKAPTTETVFYNVFVTDQFGNLVDNEPVQLTDNLANAFMNGQDNNQTVNSQLKNDGPALDLDSDVAGDQTVTGKWTTEKNIWTDGDLVTAGFQPARSTGLTETITGNAAPVNWYMVDFANSTYSLTHTGADRQPVGSTVTETYKAVDQNGEPIENVFVTFYRTGPDDLQDGDGNSNGWTDENGEVSYVFQGAKAGTATVTAVLSDGPTWAGGTIIPQGQQSDTVTFGKADINLKAGGKNNGAKADKLKVTADDIAGGLIAKVFVNGDRVAKHALNSTGDFTFKIKDKNGNKATKYVVKVAETEVTNAAKASKRLR